MNERKIILLAMPDDWRSEIHKFLSGQNLRVIEAATFEEAIAVVQSQALGGMIVISDWLISSDGIISALMEKTPKDLPTLMLIRIGKDYAWFEKLYQPLVREYATIPVGIDQLTLFLGRLRIIGQS